MRRAAALALLALLGACNAPDYTPVRDWARVASLAADYPAAAPPAAADGALAMQEALSTYLAALARMADDGVLPYLEDPFVDLAARAARADVAGGAAVAQIGRTLRLASRGNWQAPELRDTIAAFDPAVQALVAALAGSVAPEAGEAGPDAVARAGYAAMLRQVGRGHALLKDQAARITSDAVVQRINAEQDRLARAAQALPRPTLALPSQVVAPARAP